MKVTISTNVLLVVLSFLAGESIFAAELSSERKKNISKEAYPQCLRGAKISAPNLPEATRVSYCKCYSDKMAELTQSEDIDYFNKYKKPSSHGQAVVEIASKICFDTIAK